MLAKLIKEFSKIDRLPIEVSEVRDAIINMGIQDEIIFCPDEKMDQKKLWGTYYQYTYRKTMYGDASFVSLIVYCASLGVDWQRVVCCKEMIHVLDVGVEKTKTIDDLDGLVSRLLGPLSTEDFGICDIMAAKDRIALYQALPLLLPMEARNDAVRKKVSAKDGAEKALIPVGFASLMLTDKWPELVEDLTC